jgi:hypothetical protein
MNGPKVFIDGRWVCISKIPFPLIEICVDIGAQTTFMVYKYFVFDYCHVVRIWSCAGRL